LVPCYGGASTAGGTAFAVPGRKRRPAIQTGKATYYMPGAPVSRTSHRCCYRASAVPRSRQCAQMPIRRVCRTERQTCGKSREDIDQPRDQAHPALYRGPAKTRCQACPAGRPIRSDKTLRRQPISERRTKGSKTPGIGTRATASPYPLPPSGSLCGHPKNRPVSAPSASSSVSRPSRSL